MFSLGGTTLLFVGVARDQSIDRRCARARARQRVRLAVTLASEGTGRAPSQMLASVDDVSALAAFPAGREAFDVTGAIHHIGGARRLVGWALPGGRE